MKDITLNYNSSNLVNFYKIRVMILGYRPPVVNVRTEHKIKRTRKGGGKIAIVTEPEGNI